MKLVGDTEGLAALKEIREKRPEYLKFLITEARSSTLQFVDFYAEDGRKFLLKWRSRTAELIVEPLKAP
ncbi:MAG: hypothetical protein ABI333_00445 [bacterium]